MWLVEKKDYPKKILTLDQQVAQLKERGMIIENDKAAKGYLKNISYFRLQGYWWEFQEDKEQHKFREGVTLNDVINLYTFDRKLRLLVFDAIERVEIALRTKMVYYLSIELDQWWFENNENFHNQDYFQEAIDDIEKELARTKEIFIEKHFEKYGEKHKPPAYKTLEILSFGCLSKIYSNLSNDITAKTRIASEFNLPNLNFLKSWLQSFNEVRNVIAHHGRLWNLKQHFPPKVLGKPLEIFIEVPEDERSFYYTVSCLLYVLNKVSPGHSFKEKVKRLLKESDFINLEDMGFPTEWEQQSLWLDEDEN